MKHLEEYINESIGMALAITTLCLGALSPLILTSGPMNILFSKAGMKSAIRDFKQILSRYKDKITEKYPLLYKISNLDKKDLRNNIVNDFTKDRTTEDKLKYELKSLLSVSDFEEVCRIFSSVNHYILMKKDPYYYSSN